MGHINDLAERSRPKLTDLNRILGGRPCFHDSVSINGFVVIAGDRLWGSFDSPDEAAKWAIDTLSAGYDWIIKPMGDPENEKH